MTQPCTFELLQPYFLSETMLSIKSIHAAVENETVPNWTFTR